MLDREIAIQISSGLQPSIVDMDGYHLVDVRVTGTGCAFRNQSGYAIRVPDDYLNEDFLASCYGLPVIFGHTPELLDSKEFEARVAGTLFYPYIKANEVWAVAKIYSQDAIDLIKSGISTSPSVVTQEGNLIELDEGVILLEGRPLKLDHLALCEQGVWDKYQPDNKGIKIKGVGETDVIDFKSGMSVLPTQSTTNKGGNMIDNTGGMPSDNVIPVKDAVIIKDSVPFKDEVSERLDKIADAIASLAARQDAIESAGIAKKISDIESKLGEEPTDDESTELADAEKEAEKVAEATSDSVVRPFFRERATAYRQRLYRKYQSNSASFRGVDLSAINDNTALKAIGNAIIDDAIKAANSSEAFHTGQPRKHTTKTISGQTIVEYHGGSPGAAFLPFSVNSQLGKLNNAN